MNKQYMHTNIIGFSSYQNGLNRLTGLFFNSKIVVGNCEK